MNATQQAGSAAKAATDNKVVRTLGRAGLVAHGIVHLLLAYLAIQIAVSGSSGGQEADKDGALATIGAQPGGQLLLWAVALGLFALAVWQFTEAGWGQRHFQGGKRTFKRVGSAGKALVYATIGFSAAKIASSGAAASNGEDRSFSARMLALPLGQLLVGAVGVGIIAIAGYLVYYGVTKTFTEDLDFSGASASARKTTTRLGQIGYPALGVAYGIVGLLVVIAAVTYDPDKATGLDVALRTLAAQPYGAILLGLVALGTIAFGLYRFFDARFHRA